jgi:hypothetical protein
MKRWMSVMLSVLAGVAGAVLAMVVLGNASRLLAEGQAPAAAPSVMSYQGFLAQNGAPLSGTVKLSFAMYDAASGGNKVWEEVHAAVLVSEGYFAVMLGSQGAPLSANVFNSGSRYVQIKLNEDAPLPRQRLASVPYAFQADQAATANSADVASVAISAALASQAITASFATSASAAPWVGLTGVPPGFADGVDDVGGATSYEHYIVVAKSGGHYTSVAQALNAASNSSADSRFLVWVAPGIYTETSLLTVQNNVHLRGSGAGITVIRSTRAAGTAGGDAAAVQMVGGSRLSDLSVINTGTTGAFAIAIYASGAVTRNTVIDDVLAESTGSGGTAHYAIYLNDAEPTLLRSSFKAGGASTVNAALGSVNAGGGFPQAWIEGSRFEGVGASSGYGLQLNESAPDIRGSTIYGDLRGIAATVNGVVEMQSSQVQVGAFGGSFLFETTASAGVQVANSGVFYGTGAKHTGTGGLMCVNSFKANYTAASNGTTAATACN